MEPPTTVIGFVSALVQTYASGLDQYTRWKRKRSRQNHYRRHPGSSRAAVATCAVGTSLGVSGGLIKATFEIGSGILGKDFSTGDATCRDQLWTQLTMLNGRVLSLQQAAAAAPGPLDLADLLQCSETVRIQSALALADQYQRLATGRPVPKDLPLPSPRSRQEGSPYRYSQSPRIAEYDDPDDDKMTTAMTISSGPLRFQSEPPSPPPTPKPPDDDQHSTWGGSEPVGPGAANILRPKNSVFSVFCPEAMTLQVDVKKSIPDSKRCKCGYRWKASLPDQNRKTGTMTNTKDAVLLKEGFRMTQRFLAKSHRERDGYGCVLCTSSGKTEMYESAEELAAHLNASHTKWQMLHDRDMA